VHIQDSHTLLVHLLVVIQEQGLLLLKVGIQGQDRQVKDIPVHPLLKEAIQELHLLKEAIQVPRPKIKDIQVADHLLQEVIQVETTEEHHPLTKDMEGQEGHLLAVVMVEHHLKVKVMAVLHPRDRDMEVVIPLVNLQSTLKCSNGSMQSIQTEAGK